MCGSSDISLLGRAEDEAWGRQGMGTGPGFPLLLGRNATLRGHRKVVAFLGSGMWG